MGEVVYVNFPVAQRTRGDYVLDRFVDIMIDRGMCDDDILDVLDGIRNIDHYNTLDDDLKRVVNIWHQHTANL